MPDSLWSALQDEAEDRGLGTAEYARKILRNRHEREIDDTTATETLHDRLAEIEAKLDADSQPTQAPVSGPAVESESSSDPEPDGRADAETERTQAPTPAPEPESDDPYSESVEQAIAMVREHGPIPKAQIKSAFEDELHIKTDSWWRRHVRDELKDAGAEYRRGVGWFFPDEASS
jgi:hypothetical protein